ncbi:MAG: hypothetical protein JXR73_14285 [Candidatus Omnitrophica bacterium]|nr:hypothetical protein [Candidatus Omnitrophota bacterium]
MEPINESPKANEPVKQPEIKKSSKKMEIPDTIMIRMWPKTPVLYPMAILALLFGIIGLFAGSTPHISKLNKIYHPTVQVQPAPEEGVDASQEEAASTEEPSAAIVDEAVVVKQAENLASGLFLDRLMGTIFLLVFAFSLFTLSVDLEVRWALVTFASIIIVILLIILLNQQYEFLPGVLSTIASLSPMANPQFYFAIFIIWVVLMILSLGVVRFHYVRIESNEVVVVGGLLERQQRFPTMRMRYTRDIQDVFEYYMPFVRSGRLILTFAEQNESVVIDNVLNIDKVTKQLDQISGVMRIKNSANN